MDKLDQVVKARLNNIVDYIEVKDPNDAKSDEFIFSVDVDATTEINNRGRNMPHAHVICKIYHKTGKNKH